MRRLLTTALLALPLAAPSMAAERVTVLQCARLFDAEQGKLLGPHTLVLEDQHIAAVSPGVASGDSPAGTLPDIAGYQYPSAREMNIRNLPNATCLPGLIDMHVHLSMETNPEAYSEEFRLNSEDFAYRSVAYAERTLRAGFTTVRDLGGVLSLGLRDAINQGHIRGPRIFAVGTSIATTGGHADPLNGVNRDVLHAFGYPQAEDGVVSGPFEARRAVRARYKEGADGIKITATGGVLSLARSADNPQFMLDEIEAIVATAHDYGFKVAAHAHGAEGMKRAVLGGVDSIEHGTRMTDEVMQLMKQRGTWYVPTLMAGAYVSEKAAIEGYYPAVVRPKAAEIGPKIQATLARAYRAGVKIAFGTDAGVFPHGRNAGEFALLVQAGMPAEAALQSATRNAAELLGQWDQLGSLAVGKRADVVVVDGNPLENIQLMMQPALVIKDGVQVD